MIPQVHDQTLVRAALEIKWLIYSNGGNACKSAVEDVLMLRFPEVDRGLAHEVMNHIEYHGLIVPSVYARRWVETGPVPTMEDWPEISRVKIRWYRKEDS